MNKNALCLLGIVAIAWMSGCTYSSGYDVSCAEDGAVDGNRVCTNGVWVSTGGAADMSITPDAGGRDGGDEPDATNCVPETDPVLCERLGLTCDPVTTTDNCGVERTAECGTCTGDQSCGGGGTANVCACGDQTDIDFCTSNGKTCDPFTAVDACGDMRTVNCDVVDGGCPGLESCAGDNTCTCDVAAACSTLALNCGMVDVTGMCAGTDSITCGTCDDANAACGTDNVCACETGFVGDGLTCADFNECAAAADNNCDPVNGTCFNTPGGFFCGCNAGYMGNGITCLPVAGLAVSVQPLEIAMDDSLATGALGTDVIVANSVPFMTVRLEDTDDQGNRIAVDVSVTDVDEVTIERDNSAGVATAQVYLVEFDPAFAFVQSGTFSMNSASTIEPLGTAVNRDDAFVVFYFQRDNGSANRDDLFIAGNIDVTGANVEFTRDGSTGNVSGHYWVVEAQGGAFSVQHERATMDNIAVNLPVTGVSANKSLLLYSYSSDHANNDSDRTQIRCALTATTNIACRRASLQDNIPLVATQLITFSGNETIQRSGFMGVALSGGTEMVSVTLPTPVDASSMAFGGQLGVAGIVMHNTVSGSQTPGGFVTQTLSNNGTTIDLQRGTPRSDDATIDWQVVDW